MTEWQTVDPEKVPPGMRWERTKDGFQMIELFYDIDISGKWLYEMTIDEEGNRFYRRKRRY